MMASIKQELKKYIIIQCIGRIIYNFLSHVRLFFGNITTDSGTTHSQLSLKESVTYIRTVFEDYKKYAAIPQFYGHVCELGPGDNVGVALSILADGATKIDLADRFYSRRNVAGQAQIYQELATQNPQIGILLREADLENEETFPHIKRYYGPEAAGESFFQERPSTYDFIVSRSVLEHTTDPLLTLESMYHALKPGGYLIHKVDLRDHGMFTPRHHDLKFLEIPQPVYWAMTYHSGLPNRVLINRYRACAERLDGQCQFLATQLAYAGPVDPHVPFNEIPSDVLNKAFTDLENHRKRFASCFKPLSDDDLIVAGFFLVLKKN